MSHNAADSVKSAIPKGFKFKKYNAYNSLKIKDDTLLKLETLSLGGLKRV